MASARFLIPFISLPHGAFHGAAAENCPARSAGPCWDRKRLIGFCPHKSAFKTGVTSPTALSGLNLSSLRLCRRYLTKWDGGMAWQLPNAVFGDCVTRLRIVGFFNGLAGSSGCGWKELAWGTDRHWYLYVQSPGATAFAGPVPQDFARHQSGYSH